MINSTIKEKYESSLKVFPRITSLIKSNETNIKHKAKIFSTNEMHVGACKQQGPLRGSLAGYEQECNARKVNCSCVYSVYILKPVLSGRNL